MIRSAIASAAIVCAFAGQAMASTVVFQNTWDNGIFTPVNSSNAASTTLGDSGWVGTGSSPALAVQDLTLGLAVANFGQLPVSAGTTDLIFTFTDGDPSGFVFGSGATLYTTVIRDVALPSLNGGGAAGFDLTIPLPGVVLNSGFNNFGWSLGFANFNSGANFGFKNGTLFSGQVVGSATWVASQNNGSGFFTYAFGPFSQADTSAASWVATLTVPSPAAAAGLAMLGLAAVRRRR
jgi:hypothetical protein